MSIHLLDKAWQCGLRPDQKLVLLALADLAREDGEAWLKMNHLSLRTGLAISKVEEVVKQLNSNGLLEILQPINFRLTL